MGVSLARRVRVVRMAGAKLVQRVTLQTYYGGGGLVAIAQGGSGNVNVVGSTLTFMLAVRTLHCFEPIFRANTYSQAYRVEPVDYWRFAASACWGVRHGSRACWRGDARCRTATVGLCILAKAAPATSASSTPPSLT